MQFILFTVGVNGILVAMFYLIEKVSGLFETVFISDYFFYSLIVQWILAAFFSVSVPTNSHHLRHSPSKATRMAASLADKGDDATKSINDLSLSVKLFLSGALSLVVCVAL